MNAQTDVQLLRAYAEDQSETAFAELVRRHIDLVHSAALRMVRDSHLAEDVTQAAFVALAKNSGKLLDCAVLSGWLHRTAQHIAAQTVRTQVRSRIRERKVAAMNDLPAVESESSWELIVPHLDAALGHLSESDLDAVLLRYFEKKSAQEMAQHLGVSAEAAQKRLNRAVERLREFLASRGITIGASALVIVISAHAVEAAPGGLAVSVCAAVLAGTAASTSAIIATTQSVAMTTLQKSMIGAALAAAVGTGIYATTQSTRLRDQVRALQQQQAPLTDEIRKLQRERDEGTNRLATLLAENSRLKHASNQNELLKLRGQVGMLQKQNQRLESSSTGGKLALSSGFGGLGGYLSSAGVSNAGNGTAEALLQTFVYAVRSGNISLLEKFDAPLAGPSKPGDVSGGISPENSAAFKMIQTAFTNAAGFRLSSKAANDGQAYDIRLEAEPSPGTSEVPLKNVFLSLYIERKDNLWTFGTDPASNADAQSR